MANDLVLKQLDRARIALVEAKTIQATKQIVDVAAAAEIYAKRQGLSEEAIAYAHQIKIEALAQLGRILKEMPKNQGAKGVGPIAVPLANRNQNPTLSDIGIDKKTSMIAQQLAALPEETREEIANREKTFAQVRREMKEEKREARREENRRIIQSVPKLARIMTNAKFATIVIDPPWDWGDEGDVDQMGRARPDYATMSIEKLLELPVVDMADTDCHLYLWITNRSLPKGFALLEKWGFRYITCLTWVKPHFGMGNYFRGQTEQVLFGVRGSQMLKRRDAGTVFNAQRGAGGHSSKPDEFYALVESCSPGPYLEMFGRSDRTDWVTWGETSAAA